MFTCGQELLNYLHHIEETWKSILGDLPPSCVDVETVEKLQSLAPATASHDMNTIQKLMEDKIIFPQIINPDSRDHLLGNIKSISSMIPSLHTFFEGLKYLEPCCEILKSLLHPKLKKSIRQSLFASYSQPDQVLVESSKHERCTCTKSSISKDRNLGYQQLWLFAMRNFPEMTPFAPRQVSRKTPVRKEPNPALPHYLGALAVEVGFQTGQARDYQRQRPDGVLARHVLQHVNRSPLEGTVDAVERALNTARQSQRETSVMPIPNLTSDWHRLSLDRRLGRPYDDDHLSDIDLLFLPFTLSPGAAIGTEITSFFTKMDFLRSFLGDVMAEVVHYIFFAVQR